DRGGALKVNAARVELGTGDITIRGFEHVSLEAQQSITATGSGSLASDGELALAAPQVASANAGAYTRGAGRDDASAMPLHVETVAAANTPNALADTGGALTLVGSTISIGTSVTNPGGTVAARATAGDVVVESGATISVAGLAKTFGGATVFV